MAQFPSANTAYGRWNTLDVRDAIMGNNWPTRVIPSTTAWVEAGTGATTQALKDNLLYAGLGNTVYGWYNVRSLVQADTNPKSTSGLSVPLNYTGGASYSAGSTHGMTNSAPTKFDSTNGYATNSFRTAKTSAPGLHNAWPAGTRYPGLACMWFYVGLDGMHFIGNADCTTRYLLDTHPTSAGWNWIVVDIFNNVLYLNGSNNGSAGGTYTNLFCGFYMGWTNSNTIDAYWHDYRVYEYNATNHTAMRDALLTVPTSSYYIGGI
jgi:hypothetical protein